MLVHQGLDGIAKYYNNKVGEDRFNFENESFQQSENLVANDYSVNIPMIYYWKRKMHKGWINIINPFRGTIVLGTPGSGKSFGVIDLPWDNRVGNARFGQVLRCHRPVHPAARSQGLRHDGVRLQVPHVGEDALLPVL